MKEELTILKNLRKRNHYTCKEMADFVGLSKTYYWQIENKKRNLSYNNAIRIAQVFGFKPDDLFYDQTKEKIAEEMLK